MGMPRPAWQAWNTIGVPTGRKRRYVRNRKRESRQDSAAISPTNSYEAINLFMVGSAYSGSTYLGGLLAANFDAVYVGEMAHLPVFVERYGLYAKPLGCLTCQSDDRRCPLWTPEVVAAAELAGPGGSMDVVRAVTGSPVIIDGSKWPEWLRLAAGEGSTRSVPVVVVVVTRSPVAYALSACGATAEPASEVAKWWRDVYLDALRTVNRLSLPMVVVRNEDVRSRPEHVLETFASLLHQPAPPRLTPAVTSHTLGGNLWVHKGYSPTTFELYDTLGLSPRLENQWDAEAWRAAAEHRSVFELHRPKTEDEAVDLVHTVFDCPGLADIANLLGYEPGGEAVTLLASYGERNPEGRR